jgi:hypothetical protein
VLVSLLRLAMFRRLRARMHPGYAYLVVVACYPRRFRPPAIEPVVAPEDALERAEQWERAGEDPTPEPLLRELYGTGQDEAIEDFLHHAQQFR